MHIDTETVMNNLDLSKFDQVEYDIRSDIELIVSSKLTRYDLSKKVMKNRSDDDPKKKDPVDRAIKVLKRFIEWNGMIEFFRAREAKLPLPLFKNQLGLIKHTADYYRG